MNDRMTRRSFFATACAVAAAGQSVHAGRKRRMPIGLELYSVRDALAKDLNGTVTAVAKMGYEIVEFYSPYFDWTPAYATDVRKLMDDLNIKCHSTHNNRSGLEGDGLKKAIELNHILGSQTIVMASAGRTENQDDWKKVAETLTAASETLKPLKMRAGYHNHQLEFTERAGFRPMTFLAANTPKDVTLQFDVGTCVEMGYDPVAWILANPGRIRSLHLKDWGAGSDRGYRVLFGEGDTQWKPLLDAAQSKGGAEYFLIEQEGSRFPSLETAAKCLTEYRKIRA
jgi:sugar phosphate isomerase/epimerase